MNRAISVSVSAFALAASAAFAGDLDFYAEECANPALDVNKRVALVDSCVAKLCDAERYAEAEKLVLTYLPQQQAATPTNRVPSLLNLLASVYVWADRMDDALGVVKKIGAIDKDAGAKRGIEIVRSFDRADLERGFADQLSDGACFGFYGSVGGAVDPPDYMKARAMKYILDPKTSPSGKVYAYMETLTLDNSPKSLQCLDALLKLPTNGLERTSFRWHTTYKPAFIKGDWKRVVAFYRLMEKCGGMARSAADVKNRRIYALALANAGDKKAAAEACEAFAKAEKIAETDAWSFRYIAAMVRGEPVKDILKDAKLDVKDRALVLEAAGRNAQTLDLPAYAEELAKEYAACFTRPGERSLKVSFSSEVIRSVADWRAAYPKLEKALCDRPFGADVEALVTDVNTQRTIAEKKEGDNLKATVEVSAVCDRYALHVFLRVADKDARKVEHGFQNGIRTEIYFAPGDNQPYQCMGANPLEGVTFLMNTLYDSLHVKRLKIGDGFRSEVAFTDDDYVTHLVFDWKNFYDKLPKDGDHYRFDCLCWAPGGHKTWAGSRGIHHSSDWGRLVFSLTPAQLTEIKRELVLSSYRDWATVGTRGARRMLTVNQFTKWADPAVGDPAFFEKCLKDFKAEHEALAKRVKPEMDDATVNEIFDKAVPGWMGLRHVLDAKRKDFLGDELIEKGE